MAGFAAFLSNIAGTALNSIGNIFAAKAYNKYVNGELTGKEREQNEFNAQQAQINRDYETQMSNTAYQRQVADMQAAGINPALAMNGNGASTPTGSNAQGTASVATPEGIANAVAAYSQLAKTQAEVRLLNAEAKDKEKGAEERGFNIEYLKTQIEGSNLDNEQKRIINTYFERKQQLDIANAEQDLATKEATEREIGVRINKMNVEQLHIFTDMLKNLENIELMKSQRRLNDKELEHMAQNIYFMQQQGRLLGIQADNYDLTNGVKLKLDVGFGPFKAGSEQYLTLPQLRQYLKAKEEAEKNKEKPVSERQENNAGLDYRDYRID